MAVDESRITPDTPFIYVAYVKHGRTVFDQTTCRKHYDELRDLGHFDLWERNRGNTIRVRPIIADECETCIVEAIPASQWAAIESGGAR
jgi:hypothetical protein